MKNTDRLPFDHRGSMVVVRPFKLNGKTLQPGDSFDTRHDAVSKRVVRQLYDQRKINMAGSEEEVEEAVSEKTSGPAKAVFTYDPNEHLIDNEDGEWWIVDGADNDLIRVYAKVAKKLEKAEGLVELFEADVVEWADGDES